VLQLAVVEYARHVVGRTEAYSAEFDETCMDPVIIFMPEGSRTHMGGTMRLGVRDTILQTQDCHSARLYKPIGNKISERHRHRWGPLSPLRLPVNAGVCTMPCVVCCSTAWVANRLSQHLLRIFKECVRSVFSRSVLYFLDRHPR
jgi:hypothetical protein